MSPLIQSLRLGQTPRIVGTVITAAWLEGWRREPRNLPCDLVELRVDGFPDFPGWLEIGGEIERSGVPVFATLRLAKEGGHWTGPDADRWPWVEKALRQLSGVDVELHSELAGRAAALAGELNKLCILSWHDFEATPPAAAMRAMLGRAQELGAVGKIAARVNTPEDLENLRSVLGESRRLPVCLIGMGPLGRETRLTFPRAGSCLTYGYLDQPGAPGQYSAAELTERLKTGSGGP